MSKALIVLLSTLAIVACDSRLSVESNAGKPVSVAVPSDVGVASVTISEMCYDHVVYLINGKGGMAPKISYHERGALMGMSESPFIKC